MKQSFKSMTATGMATAVGVLLVSLVSAAADGVDAVFVGKVSQGGMYEVAASKLAKQRAVAQDVKDLAVTEVHDHELVGQSLKRNAASAGIPVASELNAEFRERLEKLGHATAAGFDAAYIEDMKQIHDKDEKLFAQEAKEGSGGLKDFALATDLIVKRHIGALHGTD